jgi:transcription termination factor NusB
VLKSAIIIGLGETGGEAVKRTMDYIGEARPELFSQLRACTIDTESGRLWSPNGEEQAQGKPLDEPLREVFRNVVKDVLELKVGGAPSVASSCHFIVVCRLGDDSGSDGLLHVLEEITESLRTIARINTQVSLMLFLPGAGRDGAAAKEGYGQLELLDALLDDADETGNGPQVDFTWVFSSQNASGSFVSHPRDLFPAVARFVGGYLSGDLLNDQSFGVALRQTSLGRVRRYASFGFSELRFPGKEAAAFAAHRAVNRLSGQIRESRNGRIQAAEAYAEASSFIHEHGLATLSDKMRDDLDGKSIWRAFPMPPVSGDPDNTEQFILAVRESAAAFDLMDMTEFGRRLGVRREQLFMGHRKAVFDQCREAIGRDGGRGISRAQAWLAALVGEPSPYLEGELEERAISLQALNLQIGEYFDTHMEPLVLGEILDKAVREYLEQKTALPTSRRKLLPLLEHDLDSKSRLLEIERKSLELLLEQEADVMPTEEFEGMSQGGVISTEDEVAPAPEPSVTDFSTPADIALRDAAGNSDVLRLIEGSALKLQAHQANIKLLEGEVEGLNRMIRQMRREVARLDGAIADAAERRRLLDILNNKHIENIAAIEVEARKKAVHEREATWALKAVGPLYVRLLLTRALPLAVAALALLIAFSYYIELPSLRQVEALLTVALAIFGCWSFLYWRMYKQRRQALDAVAQSRRRLLTQLYNAHVFVRSERFKHILYGNLASWRDDLTRFVHHMQTQIKRVSERLNAFEEDLPILESNESLLLEPAADPEALKKIVSSRDEQLEEAIKEFLKKHPVSSLLQASEADDGKLVEGYMGRFKAHLLENVYGELHNLSLDDYLRYYLTSETDRQDLINRALARSAPFAALSDEIGHSMPTEFCHVGLVPGPKSCVIDTLKALGHRPIATPAFDVAAALFCRVSAGFAAYEISDVRQGYQQQLSSCFGDGTEVPAKPLIPSEILFGSHDDERRKVACLGIAYGLVSWTGDAGVGVEFEGQQFASYRAWLNHICGSSQDNLRRRLRNEIEKGIEERYSTRESTIATLIAAKQFAWLDHVERAILEAEVAMYT